MKSFVRNALIGTALLGAAGLVTSTLPAQAFVGPGEVDGLRLGSQNNVQTACFACGPFDPSTVSVGLKKTKKKSAQYQRGPKDKITTTCVEGTADYDIDQCYKDIKDK